MSPLLLDGPAPSYRRHSPGEPHRWPEVLVISPLLFDDPVFRSHADALAYVGLLRTVVTFRKLHTDPEGLGLLVGHVLGMLRVPTSKKRAEDIARHFLAQGVVGVEGGKCLLSLGPFAKFGRQVAWLPAELTQPDLAPDAKRKRAQRLIPHGIRFAVLRRDGHRCVYCGASATESSLHVDHVIPVSRGGASDPSNLVTACETCNLGKSDKHADA